MPGEAQRIKADVLIVGGAITGIFAAIRVKELAPEKYVLVVDKGWAGRTGLANWGGGDITYVTPQDDLDELAQRYLAHGDGLADTRWVEWALEETSDHVRRLAEWGVPFERDTRGEILRKGGRGGGALAAVCRGAVMLKYIYRVAVQKGVKFLHRVMVTDLLVEEGCAVRGAVGFRIGQEDLQPLVFLAPAVVLVAGPCCFKATYIGHRFSTGDGLAMAFRHGAEAVGMEFAVTHNSGPRAFDIAGMARFVAMGGRFTNRLGEEFMHRYNPELGNMANHSDTIYAMAREVQEGRGPINFDLTSIKREDLELSRKIVPFTFLAMDRSGLDFTREPVEWIPCLGGNRAGGAGLKIDEEMAITIPGVFTGGDTGCKYHYGASGGYHGMNFAWCAISGWRAGRSALNFAAGETSEPREETVAAALEYQRRPLTVGQKESSLTPDEAIALVQEAIIPYDVVILKREDRLRQSLQQIEALLSQQDLLKAENPHELMKAQEAKNMALFAQMVLFASLIRQESRGLHHREDFPGKDNGQWQRHLYLKQAGRGISYNLGTMLSH